MSPRRAGRGASPAARRAARVDPSRSTASSRDLERIILPGLVALAAPAASSATSRRNGELLVGARRLPQHRPRRARPVLAVEPGADRAGGGRHRLAAADGRPVRRLERRHPGHGLDQHAGRAALRARAGHRLRARARRAAGRARGRSSSTPRRRATARSRRRRCSPASAATTSAAIADRRALRDAARRARRGDRGRPRARAACRAPSSPRPARPRPPRSTRSRAIADVARSSTGSGCTSTRRWPARR